MMNKLKFVNIIFSLSLILISISVWKLIYDMQFLAYDDNFGNLCLALLLSLLAVLTICIIWFKRKEVIKKAFLIVLLFMITSNPIVIMIACVNYECIFDAKLKQ